MVAQRDLDERLRAVEAQLHVEERDWKDEERKLFELEETYLRDTTVQGNVFTGWGDAKTAPIRFRNAALRRKKRERMLQDPLATLPALSSDDQLKVDKHRVASYSSVTSPAEPILATIASREAKAAQKTAAHANTRATSVVSSTPSPSPPVTTASSTVPTKGGADGKKRMVQAVDAKPSPAKKARKQ